MGSKKAAQTLKAKDPDYFRKLGAKGGRANPKKFEKGSERAREAGRAGGLKRKRSYDADR